MKELKAFYENLKGWIFSVRMVHFSSKSRIASMWGWGHWKYAKKYANKRHEIDGKRYYVYPAGPEMLLVFNSIELKDLKRRGFVSKGAKIDVSTLLRDSYYYTSNKKKK